MKAKSKEERERKEINKSISKAKRIVKSDEFEKIFKMLIKPINLKSNAIDVLGDNYIREVRSHIKCDKILLPSALITAQLHKDNANNQVSDLANDSHYAEHKAEIRNIAILYLCGSICHALASRVKAEAYKDYRDIDYIAKSKAFYDEADGYYNGLSKEFGI